MKIIIPLAGMGTRLRPHTYSKPKALVNVAGKPVLGHILDQLSEANIEEIIFITGYLGHQIEAYVKKVYPQFSARYLEQKEMLGQAHAIQMAKDFIDGEVLIIFGDTISETDYKQLETLSSDGVLYVREVEDPARFGVVELNPEGYITRLVEKPKTYVSNLAIIGVYYFKDGPWLIRSIDQLIEEGKKTGGEFYLADAIQLMLEGGAKLNASAVEVWEDCGKIDALLQTNRYLLAKTNNHPQFPDSIVVPPVFIGPNVSLSRSIIGPNVSIAEGTTITDSIVRDSIIHEKAHLAHANLSESVIGSNATIKGSFQHLNVGDNSEVVLND
ncbi:MAG: sugar phosphate nucleotidyltransferase [Chloroflexota bacterium]|nr:NTP transferase domain-containing protein [Chloroflexota bacterium]